MVPSINLLRRRTGEVVRFAGRQWRICALSLRGILVEPVGQHHHAVDFTYQGNAPGFDAFLTDRLWTILNGGDAPYVVLSEAVRERVTRLRDSLRVASEQGIIPFSRTSGGITYLTFAGTLVNRAIALIANQPSYDAGDIALTVVQPIQWDSVPTDPSVYAPIFPLLFEPSSGQTLFQTLLPLPLQLHEFIQDWLRDETIPQVLVRLASAKACPINVALCNAFLSAAAALTP
jgi:ATP-dependent Lhr-like helicase